MAERGGNGDPRWVVRIDSERNARVFSLSVLRIIYEELPSDTSE